MQFSLAALLLAFVVVAASFATFGPPGIVVAAAILLILGFGRSTGWARAIAWLVAVGLLMAVLLPDTEKPREWARRDKCIANLQAIVGALNRYRAEHGSFPSAYSHRCKRYARS